MSDDQNELLLEVREGKSCFEKPSITCSIVWLIILILAIGMGVGIAILVIQGAEKPPVAPTTCGMVEGTYDVEPNVFSYKGVPYAKAPVGDLRWKRPIPLSNKTGTCWTGTYKAVNEHVVCPRMEKGEVIGDEDCLLLDIYSPSGPLNSINSSPELHPVAIWMDAGPLLEAKPVSPSVSLTTNTHIVYVNVQYRYGPLGFMVADELGKNETGNYGLWDQIEALRWIKDNIHNFGGDPNQMTLISQGSGSTSGLPLITSPYTKGLIQRAWLMNTSPVFSTTLQKARAAARELVNATKCTDAKCLRGLSVKDLLKHASNEDFIMDLPQKGQFQTPMAVVDGELIREAWNTKSKEYPDIPLLLGSIAEMSTSPKLQEKARKDLRKYVKKFLDTFDSNLTDSALKLYHASNDSDSTLAQLVSDVRVGCGLDALATDAAAALNSTIYRYVVTNRPSSRSFSNLDKDNYATFGWDSYAYFEKEGFFLSRPTTDKDVHFVRTIQKMGLKFISKGTPDEAGWTAFPNSSAIIDDHVQPRSQTYHKEQCEFWQKAGLLDYGWIN